MNSIRENLRDEINEVQRKLRIPSQNFKLIRLTRYRQILHSILKKFTNLEASRINNWWWDSFLEPNHYLYPDDVFNTLSSLIDGQESVWLVIEDESKTFEHYWLYEAKFYNIILVLKELSFTEHYIVSQKLEWIICENHHNLLIGCGKPIVDKMKTLGGH